MESINDKISDDVFDDDFDLDSLPSVKFLTQTRSQLRRAEEFLANDVMELPVDSWGKSIHVGDVVSDGDVELKVVGVGEDSFIARTADAGPLREYVLDEESRWRVKSDDDKRLLMKYGLTEFDLEQPYTIQREEMQELFGNFLRDIGCNDYGAYVYGYRSDYVAGPDGDWGDGRSWKVTWPERAGSLIYSLTPEGAINTAKFWLFPYSWSEDEAVQRLPNFIHKPTKTVISWYKYPLRAARSNRDISKREFEEMLADIRDSVEDAGTFDDDCEKRIGLEIVKDTLLEWACDSYPPLEDRNAPSSRDDVSEDIRNGA